MTLLGKILVFVILVLAVAQAALHVMFHVTQTNWKDSYTKLDAQYKVLAAEVQATEAERDQVRDESAKGVQKAENDVAVVKKELEDAQTNYKTLKAQYEAEKDKVTKADTTVASSASDISRREEEVKRLEDTVKANNDRIKELVDTGNQLRDRAVAAEIESKSLKDRNA